MFDHSVSYQFHQTDLAELKRVYCFAESIFGENELMDFGQFRTILEANPQAVWHVTKRAPDQPNHPEICGMMSFSFLNQEVAEAIISREMETIELDGSKQTIDNPSHIYLAGIAGDLQDIEARRQLKLLRTIVFGELRAEFGDVSFLAKPVSLQGLKLLTEKMGFVPCIESKTGIKELYCMQGPQ